MIAQKKTRISSACRFHLAAVILFVSIHSTRAIAGDPPVAGDECDICMPITEGSFNGSTADNSGTIDDTPCSLNDVIDEWYCYTPSASGLVSAQLCGSQFDTTLAVYLACGTQAIDCDDDTCGVFPPRQAALNWIAEEGRTYFLRISGYQGDTGNYTLVIDLIPDDPIANSCDTCNQIEGQIQFSGFIPPISETWFCYTPTCNGVITASTCDSETDTVLRRYSDCGGFILQQDDDGCYVFAGGSVMRWIGFAGQTYYFHIYDFTGLPSSYILDVSCEPCFADPTGDFNFDGITDGLDVYEFVRAIEFGSVVLEDRCAGDFNSNGHIDIEDIDGFVETLLTERR